MPGRVAPSRLSVGMARERDFGLPWRIRGIMPRPPTAHPSTAPPARPGSESPMERRLGRGLGSLLGQSPEPGTPDPESAPAPGADAVDPMPPTERAASAAQYIEVAAIRRNPEQPRTTFDSEALEELQSSIRRHGVLQPICVRRKGEGYEIVSGERRWRAARSAGLERIPAVVRDDLTDEVTLELAIVENIQRQDLDPLEKARGYQALMERIQLTQDEVAERLGIARSSVANHLRLLDLPHDAQEALSTGLISMGHAKALLGIKTKKGILGALEQVVRKDLSVRATESLARGSSGAATASTAPGAVKVEPWVTEMEARLREGLGVRVTLRSSPGYKGSIQLDFSGREELERICDQIAPKETL